MSVKGTWRGKPALYNVRPPMHRWRTLMVMLRRPWTSRLAETRIVRRVAAILLTALYGFSPLSTYPFAGVLVGAVSMHLWSGGDREGLF